MKVRLSPQETAFIIHLGLRAGTPGRSILVPDLCRNFWSHSTNPQERLLHLLGSLKKKLKIPSHLIGVTSVYAEPRLLNKGFHITTDYGEFGTLLTQARVLERTDEWTYAVRDYVRAFELLRGEVFKGMYDTWSENLRGEIINKIETAAVHFVKGCIDHNSKDEARRVIAKIYSMIPRSRELARILNEVSEED
jgi:hypothetical protein